MSERKKNKIIKAMNPTARGVVDYFQNSEDLEEEIERFHARESKKKKVPLRIDSRTVILVTEDKCNPEYRQQFIERMKNCNLSLHRF